MVVFQGRISRLGVMGGQRRDVPTPPSATHSNGSFRRAASEQSLHDDGIKALHLDFNSEAPGRIQAVVFAAIAHVSISLG